MSFLEQLLGVRAEGDEKILDLNKQFSQEKMDSVLDKFTIFPSKQRLAREQLKKYPQVGGGDTGDGKTYWVEHKDVDGSHVSWVKFDNKTNKLSVPSKSNPKPRQPKSNPKPTPTPWIQTQQGNQYQKHLDDVVAKGKAAGRQKRIDMDKRVKKKLRIEQSTKATPHKKKKNDNDYYFNILNR